MKIKQVSWDYESKPMCRNGDILALVQFGEAEIAKYVSPKPDDAPDGLGDFVFIMCDNEDGLEENLFNVIAKQHPVVKQETDKPYLFLCPAEFAQKAVWDE